MRIKRLAVAAGALLVAAFVASAVAVHFLAPRATAALAESVKLSTGRELSFAEVGTTLLPYPALVLRQVRFGNATWGSQPWLAQADQVRVEIDVLDLLSHRLHVRRITVTDANVLLETDSDGNGNWVMSSSGKGAGASTWLDNAEFENVALRALTLNYRNGATGKTTSARLDSLEFAAPSASRPMQLRADATVDGKKVTAEGTLGALSALIANAPAYPVDLDGNIGEGSAGIHGTIDQPRTLDGFNLALRAEAPDVTGLAALLGANVPPLGPFRGTAQLTGSAAAPALSAIDVTAGGGEMPEISLSGAVADARAVSGIDLKIAATADDWWRIDPMKAARLPPFALNARLRDAPPGYRVDDLELKVAGNSVGASLQLVQTGSRWRVTGKVTSPLIDLARRVPKSSSAPKAVAKARSPPSPDYWKLADADLDVTVDQLVLADGRQIQAASGKIALADGHLRASTLQATLGGAKMQLDGSIADPRKLAGLDLKIALQGNELAQLSEYFGKPIPPLGRYEGRATLHDAREPAATAGSDGSVAPKDGYVFDDIELALGRTSLRGHVAFAPGEPRPRVTAKLDGPLLDLSVLPLAEQKSSGSNPLLAADVDAVVRFEKIVLPDRRVLGPVNGGLRLAAGALELKQFSVALDGASATADGTIADPLKLAGLALTMNVEVTGDAGIAAFTGQQSLKQLPKFSASGKLTDVPDGYALAGLKLVFPALTIAGDVSVTRGAERFKLQATASSPLLDFTVLSQPAPAKSAAKPAAAGARVIPDVALPLDLLQAVDADLDLRVDALKLNDAAPLGPLLVRATIADGRLRAEPVQLTTGTGRTLNASASIDATQTAWSLRLDGSGIELGEMVARVGQPDLVTGGSCELDLQLQGHGATLRAVAGSLNGNVRLKIGPNRVNNVAVDVGRGIVARLFSAANPFQKTDPNTDVKCIAARLPVKDGVFTSRRNIAVETAKYNLVVSGTVNLRTESLDLAITPIVTSGLGLGDISTIVSLGGTFAAPSVGLTAAGAIKSAASIGTTLAVPGLGNLATSLFRKVTADSNPCSTALSQEGDGD